MATERDGARYQIRRRQTEGYLLTDLIGAETLGERALAVAVVWAGVERVKLKEEISLTRAHINELLTLWVNSNVHNGDLNAICIYRLVGDPYIQSGPVWGVTIKGSVHSKPTRAL